MLLVTRRVFAAAAFACIATTPFQHAGAQVSGATARSAARTYREANEGAILTEFAELLSLPNLASDSAAIRRNADHLLAMLGKRGFTSTKLLTVPNATAHQTALKLKKHDLLPVLPSVLSVVTLSASQRPLR